jgi:hypothetical protein
MGPNTYQTMINNNNNKMIKFRAKLYHFTSYNCSKGGKEKKATAQRKIKPSRTQMRFPDSLPILGSIPEKTFCTTPFFGRNSWCVSRTVRR